MVGSAEEGRDCALFGPQGESERVFGLSCPFVLTTSMTGTPETAETRAKSIGCQVTRAETEERRELHTHRCTFKRRRETERTGERRVCAARLLRLLSIQ